jgi:hypothetical protein
MQGFRALCGPFGKCRFTYTHITTEKECLLLINLSLGITNYKLTIPFTAPRANYTSIQNIKYDWRLSRGGCPQ